VSCLMSLEISDSHTLYRDVCNYNNVLLCEKMKKSERKGMKGNRGKEREREREGSVGITDEQFLRMTSR
jgi:hypothetical protein